MKGKSIATTATEYLEPEDLRYLCETLLTQLTDHPQLVIASYSTHMNASLVVDYTNRAFPRSAVIGASTCITALTAEGTPPLGNPTVSLWALCDREGSFGTGFSEITDTAEDAVQLALQTAMRRAERGDETPDLIFVQSTPGHNDEVLKVINRTFPGGVTVIGGAAAEETFSGNWSCFAEGRVSSRGIMLAVFYCSLSISTSSGHGYQPTLQGGRVTRSNGTVVHEIDHRPAAHVYQAWAALSLDLDNATFALPLTQLNSLCPLGTALTSKRDPQQYLLAQPMAVTHEHALVFPYAIAEGEELVLMSADTDSLLNSPGAIIKAQVSTPECLPESELCGALILVSGWCLGGILAAGASQNPAVPQVDLMHQLAESINSAVNGIPSLTSFVDGEILTLAEKEIRHTTLSVTTALFYHPQR